MLDKLINKVSDIVTGSKTVKKNMSRTTVDLTSKFGVVKSFVRDTYALANDINSMYTVHGVLIASHYIDFLGNNIETYIVEGEEVGTLVVKKNMFKTEFYQFKKINDVTKVYHLTRNKILSSKPFRTILSDGSKYVLSDEIVKDILAIGNNQAVPLYPCTLDSKYRYKLASNASGYMKHTLMAYKYFVQGAAKSYINYIEKGESKNKDLVSLINTVATSESILPIIISWYKDNSKLVNSVYGGYFTIDFSKLLSDVSSTSLQVISIGMSDSKMKPCITDLGSGVKKANYFNYYIKFKCTEEMDANELLKTLGSNMFNTILTDKYYIDKNCRDTLLMYIIMCIGYSPTSEQNIDLVTANNIKTEQAVCEEEEVEGEEASIIDLMVKHIEPNVVRQMEEQGFTFDSNGDAKQTEEVKDIVVCTYKDIVQELPKEDTKETMPGIVNSYTQDDKYLKLPTTTNVDFKDALEKLNSAKESGGD